MVAITHCCCCCSQELLARKPCGSSLFLSAVGTKISEHRLLRASRGFPCWVFKQQEKCLKSISTQLQYSTNLLSSLLEESPGLMVTVVLLPPLLPPLPPPPQKCCCQSHSLLLSRLGAVPGCPSQYRGTLGVELVLQMALVSYWVERNGAMPPWVRNQETKATVISGKLKAHHVSPWMFAGKFPGFDCSRKVPLLPSQAFSGRGAITKDRPRCEQDQQQSILLSSKKIFSLQQWYCFLLGEKGMVGLERRKTESIIH